MAEIGAVSYDMPFMAQSLVKRIRADPRVDFKRDWKLVTIAVGGNDICSFVCTMENPEDLPAKHRLRMTRALRYLRDNMPRTFVNLVSIPSVETVVSMKSKPSICNTLHHGECSCWVGKLYNQTDESRLRFVVLGDQSTDIEIILHPFFQVAPDTGWDGSGRERSGQAGRVPSVRRICSDVSAMVHRNIG